MTTLERYQIIKARVDSLEREATRDQVRFEQVMERFKKEFSCQNVDEANKKMAEMESELDEVTEQLASSLRLFQSRWGKVLDES